MCFGSKTLGPGLRVTRHSAERLRLVGGKEVWAMVKAVSLDRHSGGYA